MNETISAPPKQFVGDSNTLVAWLGSFWAQVYQDPDFARDFTAGRALMAAQVYLNLLETLGTIDRTTVPVFHRERWHPMIINQSAANTGSTLELGMDPSPVIGPQTENAFLEGATFSIGNDAAYKNVVSYPIDASVAKVLTCIVDNIVRPTTVLVRDVDFVLKGNAVFFLRDKDPFTNGTFATTRAISASGAEDTQALLWACDVLVDKEFLYNHIGYVLNMKTDSTEHYRVLLNALWDLHNMGTPLRYVYAGWGALVGVPTVLSATETVEQVLTATDKVQVVTDSAVYTMPAGSTLRDAIVPGAVLEAGEYLNTAIRLYDTLDPQKIAAVSEFGTQFYTDVPQLLMPPELFRVKLQHGLSADWELSDIICNGFDSNGNPKLSITLHGTPADILAFWNDVWAYCEARNISSETCFTDYLDAIVGPAVGSVYGRVRPLEFFLRYFLKPNAAIVIIDRAQLPTEVQTLNLTAGVQVLRGRMPVYTYLFVIEQRNLGPENYALDTVDDEISGLHWSKTARDTARPGNPRRLMMTYTDRPPAMQWVPVCE